MGRLPESKVERLLLPSTATHAEQDWVEINLNPLGGDMVVALENETASNAERTISLLSALIKDWSYTEEDGSPVPVTNENVRRLSLGDLTFLADKITPVVESFTNGGEVQEKKDETSSKSSQPPAAGAV